MYAGRVESANITYCMDEVIKVAEIVHSECYTSNIRRLDSTQMTNLVLEAGIVSKYKVKNVLRNEEKKICIIRRNKSGLRKEWRNCTIEACKIIRVMTENIKGASGLDKLQP